MKENTENKTLSREEWIDSKKQERRELFSMRDTALTDVTTSAEDFRSFLELQARLPSLSVTNALLVYAQKNNAILLHTFDEWHELGCKVAKGAQGLSLLERVTKTKEDGTEGVYYNVKKVFDTSQLQTVYAVPPRYTTAAVYYRGLSDSLASRLVTVDELPGKGIHCLYDPSRDGILCLRDTQIDAKTCFELTRETALSWFAREEKPFDRVSCEYKAEAAAFIICKRRGLALPELIRSVPDFWSILEAKELMEEMSSIRRCAVEVHRDLNRQFVLPRNNEYLSR